MGFAQAIKEEWRRARREVGVLKSGVYMSSVLLFLVTLIILNSSGLCAQAQVKYGVIFVPSFPSDFPTASLHPIPLFYSSSGSNGMSYLLSGQVAFINVKFQYYINMVGEGNGNITLVASSYAFVGDVSQNLISNELFGQYTIVTFVLSPTIKSGMDGTFPVFYQAVNALSEVIDNETGAIVVWSAAHVAAADLLCEASNAVNSYSYSLGSSGSASGHAKLSLNQGMTEYAQAAGAFDNKDWNGSNLHAQRAVGIAKAASSTEAEYNLQDKVAFFVQTETYPLLIVAALILIYVVAATYRKIRPVAKSV